MEKSGSPYLTLVPYPISSVEILTFNLTDLNMRAWQQGEVNF